MRWMISRTCLAVALCAAALAPAKSRELGAIASVTQAAGRVEITTRNNDLVAIELFRSNVLRIRAGAGGKLSDAGDKAAKIVIGAPEDGVRYRLTETPDFYLLQTDAVSLRIYRASLRFEAYDTANQKLIWRELRPIDLSDGSASQALASTANEQFFGGGQQNGSFAFKGKLMDISYSGGWEEGDRPNPSPFFMSSAGYGVLHNSWADGKYDFRSDDYLTTQHAEKRFDAFYFFGGSLQSVLADYTYLTGRASLLPRWAFEYGDADCYNDGDNKEKPGTFPNGWSDGPTGKTPDIVQSVAAKYREHDMPGGWILPNDGYGCGYTELPGVVAGLAKHGFRTGLWTENGVDKIAWEVGTAGSRLQKLDVAWTGKGYQFAMDANREAAQGILDNSNSRPVLWTVMGWAGIQRYAVTWTGDQAGGWDYIRWHIPTLIGSGLSGQAYATSDVDGIFGGSPETFTRDLQWKTFTPVLMGMSGWSATSRKHPWWFDEPYRSINRNYLKLKMRLMPYTYTYAWHAEQTGAPIVRGLMWDHADDPNAIGEKYKYQFFLGRDLLVAPVYRSQATSRGWREDIYLPKGRWIDYWDGTVTGAGAEGKTIDYPVTLDRLPVLVRAGAIIPMYPEALYDGHVAKNILTLDIYPHGESSFDLYEDDGNTRDYKAGKFSRQAIKVSAPSEGAGNIAISIAPIEGQYGGMEPERAYELLLRTRFAPASVSIDGVRLPQVKDGAAREKTERAHWSYDADEKYGTVRIISDAIPARQGLQVALEAPTAAALTPTPGYPAMPARSTDIPTDSFKVLQRPLEEPGHPLENAFDGKPDTWFRTSRDQSLAFGPHEFVLYFGDRMAINGFDISPRDDANWKHGQVADYEIYVSDVNGEWGKPTRTGRLQLSQNVQSIKFEPIVGRLLRFRILSALDPEGKIGAPMVDADAPVDAHLPRRVDPITISELRLHEFVPDGEKLHKHFLSDTGWATGQQRGAVARVSPTAAAPDEQHWVRARLCRFRRDAGGFPAGRILAVVPG